METSFEELMHVSRKARVVAEVIDRIRKSKNAIDAVFEPLKERKDSPAKELRKAGETLKKNLTKLSERFVAPSDRQGLFRGDDNVAAKIRSVAGSLSSSYDAPTEAQLKLWNEAEKYLGVALTEYNKVFGDEVAAFKKSIESAAIDLFPALDPLNAAWRQKKEE
jgi:hypothetical protein